MAEAQNHDNTRALQEAQTSAALGIFLAFFGLIVLASILFTDTGIGKLTNLGAGLVITGIGAGLLYRARCIRKASA